MLSRVVVIALALSLCGCGASSSSLSATMADSIPHWAGGLPDDVPPRESDPKYADYLAKLKDKAVTEPATTDGAGATDPEPAAAAPR